MNPPRIHVDVGKSCQQNPLEGQWFVSFKYLGDDLSLSEGC